MAEERNRSHIPLSGRPQLVFAEHAVACALAAAGATRGAGRGGARMVAALCNCASASADESFHFSAAFRTNFDRCVRHLLALLKAACTGITQVFVGGHTFFLLYLGGHIQFKLGCVFVALVVPVLELRKHWLRTSRRRFHEWQQATSLRPDPSLRVSSRGSRWVCV